MKRGPARGFGLGGASDERQGRRALVCCPSACWPRIAATKFAIEPLPSEFCAFPYSQNRNFSSQSESGHAFGCFKFGSPWLAAAVLVSSALVIALLVGL